jgi:hypothetical protein
MIGVVVVVVVVIVVEEDGLGDRAKKKIFSYKKKNFTSR